MGDSKVVEPSERHALFKADSGAMRFQVKATQSIQPVFMFHSKDNPRKRLFKITIAPVCTISNFITEIGITTTNIITDLNMHHDFIEFWVTWYNKKIQLGITGQEKPSLTHTYEHDETIGYIQFEILHANRHAVEWVIEESPVILKSLPSKIFDEDLTWCRMTDNRLPPNALIGGFEKEPIYVARVYCASSLVPGKYVPATEMAFIPWSGSEHATRAFEILCGHNAKWVKTQDDNIPPDAFVAGYSEMQQQPLYVGRAMYENCLVIGKVHALYKSCFLPYFSSEITVTSYEILTVPKDTHVYRRVTGKTH